MPFDPTEMNIIQDVDFDPMSILKGATKLDSSTPIVQTPDAAAAAAAALLERQKPAPQIELSDEMLQAGLDKVRKGLPEGDETPPNNPPVNNNLPNNNKPNDVKVADTVFATHYQAMIEAGEWEPVDGFDGSEAKYREASGMNTENKAVAIVDDWFAEAFKENPEGKAMGTKLFNHLRNGGRVSDFVTQLAPTEFDFKALDSDDEATAEEAAKDLIRNYYGSIGWKADKIATRVSTLSKTGQLLDEAKQVEDPYKDLLKLQHDAEAKHLEESKLREQERARKINNGILTLLDKNHEFGNIALWGTKKEQEEIKSFIFNPDPETKQTGFNTELHNALKDPEALLFMAKAFKGQWWKNGIPAIDDTGAVNKATSQLQKTLEGALLNKKVEDSAGSDKQAQTSNGKYVFNLDEAVVIS